MSKITFDKTGTLTYGTPKVTAVESISDFTQQEIYGYAAAAEQLSEHPLGKAIVRCYREKNGVEAKLPEEFTMIPGRGVKAKAAGRLILAGNPEMLKENGIEGIPETAAEKYL